jgi:large subunit ribosomal protein L10
MVQLQKRHVPQAEKAKQVVLVQEKLQAAKMALVTEYRGLSVAEMTQLRRDLKGVRGEYQVLKNTLVLHALDGSSYGALGGFLQGPTGWVFAYEDPVALAKVLVKFLDGHEKLVIKGGVLDGQTLDQAKVKELAKMPGRNELLAKLLALMQAPATQLVRLMQEPGARMARLLEQVRKSKETESGETESGG